MTYQIGNLGRINRNVSMSSSHFSVGRQSPLRRYISSAGPIGSGAPPTQPSLTLPTNGHVNLSISEVQQKVCLLVDRYNLVSQNLNFISKGVILASISLSLCLIYIGSEPNQ